MSGHKDTFLDSTTIIAIFLVIISWLIWDHYMRTKYPTKTVRERISKPSSQEIKLKKIQASAIEDYEHIPEQTLEFKGENMDIVFSSKGFGIKQLTLKNYYNRGKEPIVFKSREKALFSNSFLGESVQSFEIKKEGDFFVGTFSSSKAKVIKTVEVKDDQFLLINKIKVEPVKGEDIKGVSLFFSHFIPETSSSSNIFKMFFSPIQDIFKGFVVYETHHAEKFIVDDLAVPHSYAQLKIMALGKKYFGKAFINNSNLVPSALIIKQNEQIQAQVDYEFLHSKAQELEYHLFLGPRSFKNLKSLGEEIKGWLDFGFFGWIARPLLVFLTGFYSWCQNWGLSIILLTLVIRLILLPININAYKSQRAMQKIQPQMKIIKEKYKSDPKVMNLEIMSLMKQNKVNPFGGCLPFFLQLPIFFAFYSVLRESVELYQSPFIFWIDDLSLKDPYYILPVLSGAIFFLQQKLLPMTLSKAQSRIFTAMTLLFPVFLLNLPSGLTLYMFVTGIFGFIQQLFFIKTGQSYNKLG